MKKLALFVFVLVLGGCSKQETYTVDYLFEHDDIRKQVIADCENNKQTEKNCTNARLAKAKKFNSVQGKEPMKTKPVTMN